MWQNSLQLSFKVNTLRLFSRVTSFVKSAGPENESSLEPWARNRDLKIWGRDFIFSLAIPNAAHLRC
jgi:hypothetical protein